MLGEVGAARAASSIIRVMAASCGSPLTASARISIVPVITVRILLKSCAMPPVSSHRLHLLGLPDPVLGRDPVGEIADECIEYEAVARLQCGDAQFSGDLRSIPPPDL